jgi:uncharacterized FAD-dependent dehydrogenase
MLRITELRLPLNHAEGALRPAIVARLGIADAQLKDFSVFKRSYDARKKSAIVLIYTIDCELDVQTHFRPVATRNLPLTSTCAPRQIPVTTLWGTPQPISSATHGLRPVVVGFGPCGIFAALILAQMGLRPIVLERGKEVRQRTKDTWGLWRKRVLNPESNVQFGEGGAQAPSPTASCGARSATRVT